MAKPTFMPSNARRALPALLLTMTATLAGCSRPERVAAPQAATALPTPQEGAPLWGGSIPDEPVTSSDDKERDDLGRMLPRSNVQVTLEEVRVTEGLMSSERVLAVLRDNRDKLESCYESANVEGLRGQMIVSFEIGPNGNVLDVSPMGESTPSATLISCELTAISAMQFPEPPGGKAKVLYTLAFQPAVTP